MSVIFPPIFVAEVKPCSPFGYKSALTSEALYQVARRFGDMISIHTDERFDGSFLWLAEVYRRENNGLHPAKPILAKGIHPTDDDIERALGEGADRVLVVGRIPADKYLDKIWYEPLDWAELEANRDTAQFLKVVWNERDLKTGNIRDGHSNSWMFARGHHPGWMCHASFIRKVEDIGPGADAFIVGEHLVSFVNSRF